MRARSCLTALLLFAACDLPEDPTPDTTDGSLRISTTTTGGDLDIDGYQVAIGSLLTLGIGVNAAVTVPQIRTGTHTLTLTGVADNCAVAATSPSSVKIEYAVMAQVAFAITCAAQGIEVRTRTTGPDQPVNGFRVSTGIHSLPIAANGSVIFDRMPAGSHTVSLLAAGNCSVAGGITATATVVKSAVTMVTFDITCSAIDRRIVFVKDSTAGGFYYGTSLHFMHFSDATGSINVRLGAGSGPAWSPDGKKLAYSTVECDYYYSTCAGALAVLDIESDTRTVLANRELGTDPAWSPDGSLLAYTRVVSTTGLSRLYVARPDNSPHQQLDVPCSAARHASWSPDGQRIVFECDQGATRVQIAVIRRDGTGFTTLTGDTLRSHNPAWSPDGATIAFSVSGATASNVWLMTSAGTNARLLVTGFDPAWSPDSSLLVFARVDGIHTIRPDGTALTRIVEGRYHAPAWRP